MFVFKIFSVILSLQIVWTLTAIEDKFLTHQLMEYFDEESAEMNGEVIAASNQKRAAAQSSSGEERFASLFSPVNLTSRANHYWTRKRGRDSTIPPQTVWEIYYTLYPTQRSLSNFISDKSSLRKKREAIVKLLKLNKVSSRAKRELEKENNAGEKETPVENLPKPSEDVENKAKERPKWGNFERKL